MAAASPHHVHGTAVALAERGLLILGASGSGKSTLALELIALGATLVADDRVLLNPKADETLTLSAPDPIAGRIEARGLGLLELPHTAARAVAVVTLDTVETVRLPEARKTTLAGITLPLLRKVESPAFAAILLAYLKGKRTDP